LSIKFWIQTQILSRILENDYFFEFKYNLRLRESLAITYQNDR